MPEAAPMMGGTYSAGPTKGAYRAKVTDVQITEAKTSGRAMATLELTVDNDPNHPAQEGKKLTIWKQALPMAGDEPDKAEKMKGMIKRMLYDPFAIPWPEKPTAFDLRPWLGKCAYFLMDDTEGADGSTWVNVTDVAGTLDKLRPLKAKKTKPVGVKQAGSGSTNAPKPAGAPAGARPAAAPGARPAPQPIGGRKNPTPGAA